MVRYNFYDRGDFHRTDVPLYEHCRWHDCIDLSDAAAPNIAVFTGSDCQIPTRALNAETPSLAGASRVRAVRFSVLMR